jgi:catechol 2,3-dioxygenase-like lactoylglutathione lyase family enzyme
VSNWTSQEKHLGAVTLFVEDLLATKRFYEIVFDLPVHFEDESSVVFRFGSTLINLLDIAESEELVAPATVADRDSGSRFQFTIAVDDADAVCEELISRGVVILNGPMDRPWGIRTACFADPSGHLWEIAQTLS